MRRARLILLAAACSTNAPAPVPAPVPTESVVAHGPSIYDLGLALVDARGATIGIDVARGSPVLVTMFYASCQVACPALIADVKRTLDAIGRDDVRVVAVSFDPGRDTPAKLAELARAHDLDGRWTLAAAAEADARELAATLGYKYRKLDNGAFFHSATVIALDADGRLLARSDGFNQRAPLVSALRR